MMKTQLLPVKLYSHENIGQLLISVFHWHYCDDVLMVVVQANKRIAMKKNMLSAVGIAAMLLGNPPLLGFAEVNGSLLALGSRPSLYVDSPPLFVYVPELGYSVAVESPYDCMYYDNSYYIYDNGYWYSSSFYDGPWVVIMEERLPPLMRGHRIPDIRRFRDIEYGRHDLEYWRSRDLHDRRSPREMRFNNNHGLFDGRGQRDGRGINDGDGDGRRSGEGRPSGEGQRIDDNRGTGNSRSGGDGHGGGHGRGR